MHGFVAQWIERLSPEQKVVGSIPIKPTTKTSEGPVAQSRYLEHGTMRVDSMGTVIA